MDATSTKATINTRHLKRARRTFSNFEEKKEITSIFLRARDQILCFRGENDPKSYFFQFQNPQQPFPPHVRPSAASMLKFDVKAEPSDQAMPMFSVQHRLVGLFV